MPKNNKPKIFSKCVANHYAGPNDTVAEFTGGGVGGLLSLRQLDSGRLQLYVYRQDAEVDVAVAGYAVISKDSGNRTDPRKNILSFLAETAERIQVAGSEAEINALAKHVHGYLSGWLGLPLPGPQGDDSAPDGSKHGSD